MQGAREAREKQKEKSISEIFSEIISEMCDRLCRWPLECADEEELYEYCEKCPLNRL